MKRYIGLLALMLCVAPGTLAGQQSPDARIEAARRQARSAGIPVALLDSRVAEGRAKGVPMDRIAAAVERRAQMLARAQDALRGARGVTTADLSAGADAAEAGIGAEALRQVVARARAEDRPVALAVLTYLHRERGLPVDQAVARVTEALGQGPEALRELPTRGAAGQERRGPPEGAGPPDRARGRPSGGGPPSAVPAPGKKPGAGKPDDVGKPDNPGGGKGRPTNPGRGQ